MDVFSRFSGKTWKFRSAKIDWTNGCFSTRPNENVNNARNKNWFDVETCKVPRYLLHWHHFFLAMHVLLSSLTWNALCVAPFRCWFSQITNRKKIWPFSHANALPCAQQNETNRKKTNNEKKTKWCNDALLDRTKTKYYVICSKNIFSVSLSIGFCCDRGHAFCMRARLAQFIFSDPSSGISDETNKKTTNDR